MAPRAPSKQMVKRPLVMAAGAGPGHFEGTYPSSTQGVASGSLIHNASLSAPQSEDEVAMVRTATEVLGIDHVARWMQNKIPSLGNQTPYALIQTTEGRRQVLRVLLEIEHGVY